MADEQPQTIQITLHPDGVVAPLLTILGQSANNVLFGLQLIDSVEKPIDIQEIKSEDTFFSFQFSDPSQGQDISLNKENFKLWILQKGFEDLIKGVNLSLIEAYFFCSLVLKRNDLKTYQHLQTEIEELRETALKQSLPGLLSKVKPALTADLTYEEEINSINKVRNCLVHRNGVVTDKDVNDIGNRQLKVQYSRMKLYADKDGQEVMEVKKNTFVEGGTSIKLTMVKESIIFNLDDRVKFNYQQFNHLLTTCYLFGIDLTQKLPKIPDNPAT
jgi:hypothetical protein